MPVEPTTGQLLLHKHKAGNADTVDGFNANQTPTANNIPVLDVSAKLPTTALYAASDTVVGVMEMAVQSEQETGTDVVRAVSPGRQQYHPSAAKFWVMYNQITPAVGASYNVSSVTDSGTGVFKINYTISFSSATYGLAAISGFHSGVTEDGTLAVDSDTGLNVGYCYITCHANSSNRSDANQAWVVGFGDQ